MESKEITAEVPGLRHSGEEAHLLREVMRTYQALLNVFSRQVGMSASQLTLLRLLALNYPAEMGILEIARRLGVNAAAVSRQVKEIAAQNLVARRPEPQDGRRLLVKLTPEGLQTFHQIHERAHDFEKSLEANLSSAEIATAAKVLMQLRAGLEDFSFKM
jgi:DNA-binding MarR family transcriptional regulator